MDITFIVTGHCMHKYPDNTDYMIHTLESFKLIKNFNDSKVIIALDGNENQEYEEKYTIYKKKLLEYIKNKSNYELVCHNKNLNLVKNIYETLKLITTKYVFLIQQDLSFVNTFDLKTVLDDLENLPQIKHLRFNDTKNIRITGRNDDNNKFGEKKIERNNIYISTGVYCDRNHISRLEYYNDFIFKDGPLMPPKGWRYPCFGMEHILAKKPMKNQELYGTYIYGDIGYEHMIIHYKAGRGRDLKIL
jgi:hypothetical protein